MSAGTDSSSHAGPYPHADCILAFKLAIAEENKQLTLSLGKAVADAVAPLTAALNRLNRDVYGEEAPGMKQTLGELHKWREDIDQWRGETARERAESRSRWITLLWSQAGFAVLFIVAMAIFYVRVGDHMSNSEIHPRMVISGDAPFFIPTGDNNNRLLIIPQHGDSKASLPSLPGVLGGAQKN